MLPRSTTHHRCHRHEVRTDRIQYKPLLLKHRVRVGHQCRVLEIQFHLRRAAERAANGAAPWKVLDIQVRRLHRANGAVRRRLPHGAPLGVAPQAAKAAARVRLEPLSRMAMHPLRPPNPGGRPRPRKQFSVMCLDDRRGKRCLRKGYRTKVRVPKKESRLLVGKNSDKMYFAKVSRSGSDRSFHRLTVDEMTIVFFKSFVFWIKKIKLHQQNFQLGEYGDCIQSSTTRLGCRVEAGRE